MKKEVIEKSYQLAKEQYAALGIDTDKVLSDLDKISISCIAGRRMMLGVLRKPDQFLEEEVSRLQAISPVRQKLLNR